MQGQPPPARQVNHLSFGSMLGFALGIAALLFGLGKLREAQDNPQPTIVNCDTETMRGVGPNIWTEVRGCALDMEAASELHQGDRITALYIPLLSPETGELVGILALHDADLLQSLVDDRRHRTQETQQAATTRLQHLLTPPLRGFTAHAGYAEKGAFRHFEAFEPADLILEYGRAPQRSLSFGLLGLASLLLIGAAVLGYRVKRAWAADAADLAAWHAARHSVMHR